jgi:hypothetical protein
VVTVRVWPAADGSRVAVEGAAKQTVIKNKAAEQSGRRVADVLLRSG